MRIHRQDTFLKCTSASSRSFSGHLLRKTFLFLFSCTPRASLLLSA